MDSQTISSKMMLIRLQYNLWVCICREENSLSTQHSVFLSPFSKGPKMKTKELVKFNQTDTQHHSTRVKFVCFLLTVWTSSSIFHSCKIDGSNTLEILFLFFPLILTTISHSHTHSSFLCDGVSPFSSFRNALNVTLAPWTAGALVQISMK